MRYILYEYTHGVLYILVRSEVSCIRTVTVQVFSLRIAHGFLPSATIDLYGPFTRNTELISTIRNRLYVFPSVKFSCDGTITEIRMRMEFASNSILDRTRSGSILSPLP